MLGNSTEAQRQPQVSLKEFLDLLTARVLLRKLGFVTDVVAPF